MTGTVNQVGSKKCEIRKISQENRSYAYIQITAANGVPSLSFNVLGIEKKKGDRLIINLSLFCSIKSVGMNSDIRRTGFNPSQI